MNSQTLKDEWVVCNSQGCKLLDPYFSEGVSMKWDGPCLNGKANGYGILTKYKNGEFESTYQGDYRNGIREGKGKFSHKDGSVKEGDFVNGQMTGKGVCTDNNGNKFTGDFLNYRMHGFGKMEYANGSTFEGFFVSDNMYIGKFINFDGKIFYYDKGLLVDKITSKPTGYKPVIGIRLTEYFDENWIRCKPKEASFYRLVTYESENKPKGVVKDYFISGALHSEFTAVYLDYDDEGKNFYEGEATWYFPNGKVEQKRFYFNNKINGRNAFYYENGQMAKLINYSFGITHGSYQEWYKSGKTRFKALYENGKLVDNKFIEYDEEGIGALVYLENFNANRKEWEAEYKGSTSYVNNDGSLSLDLINDMKTIRYNYIPINQNSNYSIETIIQKKTGTGLNGYGLLFGFKDWNNFYEFAISESGSYVIWGTIEGVNVKLCELTQSKTVYTSNKRNELKVIKFNDEFIFSINGEIVERLKSCVLRGNNFGIMVNGRGEYLLESLIIREFKSQEELEGQGSITIEKNTNNWKGNGSGFFINEKGYIATNYHVVKDASSIQVEYFQKGKKKTFSAKVIVSDKQNDLAIIRINDPNFINIPKIPYVFTSTIKDVGTEVFALGYPIADVMGDEIKFTDGKISSKTGIEGDITVYQISVPIQPGNSGGPLFDSKGNLIGITSAGLNKEYFNSENVNYAIKTTYLKNLIDVLPEKITLPNNTTIYTLPLTEKIKTLSDFIPIIRVK